MRNGEMRYQAVYKALHKEPFRPFRIQLTNGQSHLIQHPDFAWLTRTSVLIGHASGTDDVPDDFTECDMLHIVAIEPVNGKSERGGKSKGRK
jgi:hypothetical protein